MNFYFETAKALDRLDAKKGSIKGVVSLLPEKDRRRAAALVIETLKYKAVLTDVIHASDLLKQEKSKVTSVNLVLLLVHDLLLAKGIQAGDGPIKQAILRHKTRLQAELTKLKIKRGVKSVSDLAQAADPRTEQIPRYARVNTLVWTVENALSHFHENGYSQTDDPLPSNNTYRIDEHVPNLLAFHPSTTLQDVSLLDSGRIVLQDKASCFPAVILNPPDKDDIYVIDATSAPGNKTSLLSALMKGKGKIFAFERDKRRFGTLKKMLAKARCRNVDAINADFLTVDPLDAKYSKVTHILLDPSCSGSGIVNRLDHLLETEEESDEVQEDRLQKLAAFQLMMIKHAMKFPSLQKLVYSTCSVYSAENEDVVLQALSSDEARSGNFRLARKEDVLPSWPRRGLSERMGDGDASEALIRCVPGEDRTNGFFVSCFIKRAESREDWHDGTRASSGSSRPSTAKCLQPGVSGNAKRSDRKRSSVGTEVQTVDQRKKKKRKQ